LNAFAWTYLHTLSKSSLQTGRSALSKMLSPKLRKAPSLYPRVPFYLFRAIQLLASAICERCNGVFHVPYQSVLTPHVFWLLLKLSAKFRARRLLYPVDIHIRVFIFPFLPSLHVATFLCFAKVANPLPIANGHIRSHLGLPRCYTLSMSVRPLTHA
jgi:hypothetical protein